MICRFILWLNLKENFQFCLTGVRRSVIDQMLKKHENYRWNSDIYPSYTGSADYVLLTSNYKLGTVIAARWYKARMATNAFFILWIIHNQIQLLQAWYVMSMHNINLHNNNNQLIKSPYALCNFIFHCKSYVSHVTNLLIFAVEMWKALTIYMNQSQI